MYVWMSVCRLFVAMSHPFALHNAADVVLQQQHFFSLELLVLDLLLFPFVVVIFFIVFFCAVFRLCHIFTTVGSVSKRDE